MPVGHWNFYAKDNHAKEYLLKSGTYLRSLPEMFEVKNIDSGDLLKNYQLSFYALQQSQLKTVPFIKTFAWQYYQANGKLWKRVNYQVNKIPVNTRILMQDNDQANSLIIVHKDDPDEWINTAVNEYDEHGILFKKTAYDGFGEISNEHMYNKKK